VSVLVTGAAGFVGSVLTRELLHRSVHVIGLDNLQQGHQQSIPQGIEFVGGSVGDPQLLQDVFQRNNIESVIHLAAEALVGPSMTDPARYFVNNTAAPLALLDTMREHGVDRIIFSSTAAVYGEPESVPILEDAPKQPSNSYGESKLMFERMLDWYGRAYGLKYAILRFFNVAGAAEVGEHHEPETHLIPIVLSVALGQRQSLDVFGSDYPTRDGSCVRDYVHVSDVVDAHLRCLDSLEDITSAIYNLGNGTGYSVLEVIDAARKVTGHEIPANMIARRPGDPPSLIASYQRIREAIGWEPQIPDIESIVKSAWVWHESHPRGYQ